MIAIAAATRASTQAWRDAPCHSSATKYASEMTTNGSAV